MFIFFKASLILHGLLTVFTLPLAALTQEYVSWTSTRALLSRLLTAKPMDLPSTHSGNSLPPKVVRKKVSEYGEFKISRIWPKKHRSLPISNNQWVWVSTGDSHGPQMALSSQQQEGVSVVSTWFHSSADPLGTWWLAFLAITAASISQGSTQGSLRLMALNWTATALLLSSPKTQQFLFGNHSSKPLFR